mmetsp:Transcript_24027/g.21056  ORF Transcript_24027/g.21056 Transcript_24027/m.21056 type:complete len:108 (-) Transcript_24027:18-341(-)
MNAINVKFVAIARIDEGDLLCGHAIERSFESNFKNEASNLLTKLKSFRLEADERQQCHSPNGCWFCQMDKENVVYLALCSKEYPERIAYQMIEKIQNQVEEIPDYAN